MLQKFAYDIGLQPGFQFVKNLVYPESWQYCNTLDRVVFLSSVIAPEALRQSSTIAAIISDEDLKNTQKYLLCIGDLIEKLASQQGYASKNSLLSNLTNPGNAFFTVLGNATTSLLEVFGARDIAHDVKEEMFRDIFKSFEGVGVLASKIKAESLRRCHDSDMATINSYLDALSPILKESKIL